jgi:hypothetical protein
LVSAHHETSPLSTVSAGATVLSQAAAQRDTLTSRAFLSFDKLRAQVEDLLGSIDQLSDGDSSHKNGDRQDQQQATDVVNKSGGSGKSSKSPSPYSKQVLPNGGWVIRRSVGGTATIHDLMREAAAALAAANRWQGEANEGMRAAQAAHRAAWTKV